MLEAKISDAEATHAAKRELYGKRNTREEDDHLTLHHHQKVCVLGGMWIVSMQYAVY